MAYTIISLTDLCSFCCSNGDRASNTNGVESIGKEILAALFSAPEIPEEPELPKKRIVRPTSRYAAYGHLVVEPPTDTFLDSRTPVVYQQHHIEDGMHPFLYTGVSVVPCMVRKNSWISLCCKYDTAIRNSFSPY